MTVIARRKGGIGIMYLVCTFLGIGLFAFGIYELGVYGLILGACLAVPSAIETVQYYLTPREQVRLEGSCKLHFPRGVILDAKDIISVSYRRASARGTQYKWGTVTVSTHLDEIKLKFVADCEEVEKTLTELMYKRQMELENFPLD